ncbi:hypothetical protein RSOLAG1IB_07581 [Rhizoctonia solani AG-1 IB]|uniref:Uncharacterized protein n=1 Tax=Thanatephorus cucumeris (strain AG1-IB / isolate 7/3/14) TaxID=1108050 RepID=A0A0B7FIS8_THACB|nr:hypothetical protein RSOLAG1IB_07581 [Rhizoctonia solani AG-1 IB]
MLKTHTLVGPTLSLIDTRQCHCQDPVFLSERLTSNKNVDPLHRDSTQPTIKIPDAPQARTSPPTKWLKNRRYSNQYSFQLTS